MWIEITSRCPTARRGWSYRASGMWIEMFVSSVSPDAAPVIPRERYVDWNNCLFKKRPTCFRSYRASGMWIEITVIKNENQPLDVIPRERYVDWNRAAFVVFDKDQRHTARAVCGLKYQILTPYKSDHPSYRASGMWIEIDKFLIIKKTPGSYRASDMCTEVYYPYRSTL